LHAEEFDGWRLQAISVAWTVPIYGLALLGLWRLREQWRRVLLLLTPVIYLSLVYMVFVGSVRYRIPFVPVLDLLAGIGLCGLVWARRREGADGIVGP
jgi:hypothetical protein